MKMLIVIFMFLSLLAGATIMSQAQSAIHEILAGVMFLNGAIFLCAATILDTMDRHSKKREVEADNNYNALIVLAGKIGKQQKD